MPTFEIPDGPTTVELKAPTGAPGAPPAPATGSVVFNVTNKSTDSCAGRLSVVPAGSAKEEWFTIDGDRERTFAAGETQTAKINISAPANTAAGDYAFKLRAVAVNDPDNDHAEGPVVTAKVAAPTAPPVGKKSLWWLWVLIGLLVLALIAGGIWFAFLRDKGPKTVEAPDFTKNGETFDQAKAEPKGFKLTGIAGQPGTKPAGTIIAQDPAPKSPVLPGAEIKLTYDPGTPQPRPPIRIPQRPTRIEGTVFTRVGTRVPRPTCAVKIDPARPNVRDHRC